MGMSQPSMGMILVAVGLGLTVIGVLIWSGAFGWFGRLPGDFRFEGERSTVYVPLASMLVLSIVATLLLHVARRVLGG